MAQPPVPGRGEGEEPGRRPGLPGGSPASVPLLPPGARDPRLPSFAKDDAGDRFPPGGWLAMVLDELSGPDRRCAGATDDELTGLLGRWAALESWAAAARLGVAAELVRRRALPGHEPRVPGGMPTAWEQGTGHEISGALAISLPAADKLVELAVILQTRLPRIAALLAAGVIDVLKARIVADELSVLDDAAAAQAEALILGELAGKTPGQVGKLAAAVVVSVDPEGARKRRERAERDDARVRFWRERAGTAALAGCGLPTDAALAANANIKVRAVRYKRAKVSPGATMEQLRVLAFLDILNGVTADARIAQARAEAHAQAGQPGQPGSGEPGEPGEPGGPADPGDSRPDDSGPVGEAPRDAHEDDDGSGTGDAGPALAANTDLTIPLVTLLGLVQRPGEGHGLGPLDPALCADLAAAAARSPHSAWCVTVTGPDGIAIGHGCGRPARRTPVKGKRGKPKRVKDNPAKSKRNQAGQRTPPPPGNRDGPWAFTPRDGPGPPDGYGTWTLTLAGGTELAVRLAPIPVTECDHRYETRGYQPSDTLRHLVQVRDGDCTFPTCSRHARDTDLEHAVPFDQGGRTCACNAGARSRRCHQVKQSKGWKVTQPRPGWHQWTTPSGRTYTQGPKRYPA